MNAPHTPLVSAATLEARHAALVERHRAAFRTIRAYTDFPSTLERALQVERQVNELAATPSCYAIGMLGDNGLWPEVEGLVSSARFHGREWRARLAALDIAPAPEFDLLGETVRLLFARQPGAVL